MYLSKESERHREGDALMTLLLIMVVSLRYWRRHPTTLPRGGRLQSRVLAGAVYEDLRVRRNFLLARSIDRDLFCFRHYLAAVTATRAGAILTLPACGLFVLMSHFDDVPLLLLTSAYSSPSLVVGPSMPAWYLMAPDMTCCC